MTAPIPFMPPHLQALEVARELLRGLAALLQLQAVGVGLVPRLRQRRGQVADAHGLRVPLRQARLRFALQPGESGKESAGGGVGPTLAPAPSLLSRPQRGVVYLPAPSLLSPFGPLASSAPSLYVGSRCSAACMPPRTHHHVLVHSLQLCGASLRVRGPPLRCRRGGLRRRQSVPQPIIVRQQTLAVVQQRQQVIRLWGTTE